MGELHGVPAGEYYGTALVGALAGDLATRLDVLFRKAQADQVYGLSRWSYPPPYGLGEEAVFSAARRGFEYRRDYRLRVLLPGFPNPLESSTDNTAYVELGIRALMGEVHPEGVILRRQNVGESRSGQASTEDLHNFGRMQLGELFDPRKQKVKGVDGNLEIVGRTRLGLIVGALRNRGR